MENLKTKPEDGAACGLLDTLVVRLFVKLSEKPDMKPILVILNQQEGIPIGTFNKILWT